MIRGIFATFFMFLFIILFLPVALGYGIYATFSDRNFYENEFVDVAYDYFIFEGQQFVDFQPIKNIDKEDFSAVLSDTVKKADLKIAVESVLEQVDHLVVDKNGLVVVKIPLLWITGKTGLFADKLVQYLYENLPKCTADKIDFYREFDCIPKDLPQDDFAGAFRLALDRELVSDIPNEFVFRFSVPKEFAGANLKSVFVQIFSKVASMMCFSLLAVFLAIGLVIFSPAIKILKWWAKTLFFAALLVMLVVMALNVLVPGILGKLLSSQGDGLGNYSNVLSMYILVIGVFTKNLVRIILPMVVIGLGFWIVGMFYDRNYARKSGSEKFDPGYKELH